VLDKFDSCGCRHTRAEMIEDRLEGKWQGIFGVGISG